MYNLSKKNIICFFLALPISLILGSKIYGHWADEDGYSDYFSEAANTHWSFLIQKSDPLFYIYYKTMDHLSLGQLTSNIILAIATLFIFVYNKDISKNRRILFLILYCSYLSILHVYTQIRFGISFALLILAINEIEKKRRLRPSTLILLIASSLLHLSSLIIFIIYKVSNRIKNPIFIPVATLIFCQLLLSKVLPSIGFEKVKLYYDLMNDSRFNQINLLSFGPIFYSITLTYIYLSNIKNNIILDKNFRLAIFSPVLYYSFTFLPTYSYRFYEAFAYFYIVTLVKYWKNNIFYFTIATIYFLYGVKISYDLLIR